MLRRHSRLASLLCLCIALPILFPGAMTQSGEQGTVEQMHVDVMSNITHDNQSFTQGLLISNGSIFESTGIYGSSKLNEINISTGDLVRTANLNASYFGEGLAIVDDNLIQLTWRENTALVWNVENFSLIANFSYEGEGWGLCNDGVRLIMSNGTSSLTFRNKTTFAVEGVVNVTMNSEPLERLNELECVGDIVYANVWMTDLIVAIEPDTGEVIAAINATGLLTENETLEADVLNGIAHDGEYFWITGKYWPWIFQVEFESAVQNGTNQTHNNESFPQLTKSLGVWDEASVFILPLLVVITVIWIIDIRIRSKTAKGQGTLDTADEMEGGDV